MRAACAAAPAARSQRGLSASADASSTSPAGPSAAARAWAGG
eukprot:gene24173-16148_t